MGDAPCPGDLTLRCICQKPASHRDYGDLRHICSCCESPIAPPPPTGPEIDVPGTDANRYTAYRGWLQTEDGRHVWGLFVAAITRAIARNETRWSPRDFASGLRADLKIKINNTYTAWLADDMIALFPEAEAIIERRKRKKAKV